MRSMAFRKSPRKAFGMHQIATGFQGSATAFSNDRKAGFPKESTHPPGMLRLQINPESPPCRHYLIYEHVFLTGWKGMAVGIKVLHHFVGRRPGMPRTHLMAFISWSGWPGSGGLRIPKKIRANNHQNS